MALFGKLKFLIIFLLFLSVVGLLFFSLKTFLRPNAITLVSQQAGYILEFSHKDSLQSVTSEQGLFKNNVIDPVSSNNVSINALQIVLASSPQSSGKVIFDDKGGGQVEASSSDFTIQNQQLTFLIYLNPILAEKYSQNDMNVQLNYQIASLLNRVLYERTIKNGALISAQSTQEKEAKIRDIATKIYNKKGTEYTFAVIIKKS